MSQNAIPAQGSTVEISTGSGSAQNITGLTLGLRTTVNISAHGRSVGDRVTFASVGGTTQLNGLSANIIAVSTNSYLVDVDSSGFSAYTTGGTATPVAWTKINDVKSFSGLDGQVAELDVSDLDSLAKEYRPGLRDNGGFNLELNRRPADPGQAALLASADGAIVRQFRLSLPAAAPTPRVATFSGYVRQMPISGAVDAIATSSVGIRITGAVTWS